MFVTGLTFPVMIRIKKNYLFSLMIGINIAIIIFDLSKMIHWKEDTPVKVKQLPKSRLTTFEEIFTIVIRDFEHYDNDIVDTVDSLLNVAPTLQVIIVSNSLPYPPLQWKSTNHSSVKLINLRLEVGGLKEDRDVVHHVHTPFVVFVPDSVRVASRKALAGLLHYLGETGADMLAAPFSLQVKPAACWHITLNVRLWTLVYDMSPSELLCDGVSGKHILVMKKAALLKLPDPFMLPFPDALYIQATAKNMKTRLLRTVVWNEGRPLQQSQHLLWKTQRLHQERQQRMFERLAIKHVVRDGKDEWYGCTRDSARCFGTVIADTPAYLLEGKWTPPCCLNALRATARHVFKQLESAGVRYWLEGGSLLGAMRSGDILPWDYDVDVGFMRDDLPKLTWLLRASRQPVVDTQGFVWEKASEGEFFRVQYSRSNRLHVDLFPFYNKNGTMTKDSWFQNHKQDREFSAHFLNPLASIKFIGQEVSAPNNIPDFLELKFGQGAIETPAYPNPNLLQFPPELIPTKKKPEVLDYSP